MSNICNSIITGMGIGLLFGSIRSNCNTDSCSLKDKEEACNFEITNGIKYLEIQGYLIL